MTQLVQLAGTWSGRDLPAGALIERKWDGFRMFWGRDWKGNPTLFTRGGIPFEGVAHIAHELAAFERHAGEPYVFDGEFIVGDGPNTLAQTKAWFERDWKRGGNAGRFYLFDALPFADWLAGGTDVPLWQRKQRLARIAQAVAADEEHRWDWRPGSRGADEGASPVVLVDHVEAWCVDDVVSHARAVWDQGGEGIVIKNAFGGYRRSRSNDWLKVGRPWRDKLNFQRAA